ncbi:diguanylate phosphodiesterase [Candidatus Koribacter versatilis Ellin345]|uniref:Diguanylate phosphodiesterase n=1 Tax=Koribacter versatilis (strain Ellin345) TaxID=204669 RepID=Q1IUU8_KORVE|nr:HDOD domain-containing protein [Candidatus Koribacter versatilis]ABF39352.1 diguanylate phosphodiesterase [Candidatus Koribacter versatilis Ellin345]
MLRYIARQAILDTRQQTFGYELLYRAAAENFARIGDPDEAARRTLDDLLTLGVKELSRGKQLFLNCTHELLAQGFVKLLPTQNLVLEILETVVPDHDLLQSCAELKAAGYSLALDDFIPGPNTLPLVEFADYIKLDFRAMPLEECGALVQQFGKKIEFLAEKVETLEEFTAASDMGCSLFQGFFFAQPALLTMRQIPPMYVNYIRLLDATCKPDFNFAEIEAIIKTDVALSYKLLRFLNSAAFCIRSTITSLRQALIILGENAIRRWVAVSAAANAATGKPPELLISALLRARFCELLAVGAHSNPYWAFTVGLFSMLSPLLDTPLETILASVQLPDEVRAALLGESGQLRTLFELVCGYIEGDWIAITPKCLALGLAQKQVTSCYLEAVRSVDALMALA